MKFSIIGEGSVTGSIFCILEHIKEIEVTGYRALRLPEVSVSVLLPYVKAIQYLLIMLSRVSKF